MKKSIIWLVCLAQVVFAGSNISEIRRNQVVVETSTGQVQPDSVQTVVKEVKEPLEVEKKQKKQKKNIVLTALRIVLSVVLIVLLVVIIAVLV